MTPGDTAQATISGDAPNQTLNLVLPKGDKGDKGDTGADGAQGADGITPHIDDTTKHWMIGETDTGVSAQAIPGVTTYQITEVDPGNYADINSKNVPVGLKTNTGTYYPI